MATGDDTPFIDRQAGRQWTEGHTGRVSGGVASRQLKWIIYGTWSENII